MQLFTARQENREMTADRKQTFDRTTVTHTVPIKQAGVDCCSRGCFDPTPNTNDPH